MDSLETLCYLNRLLRIFPEDVGDKCYANLRLALVGWAARLEANLPQPRQKDLDLDREHSQNDTEACEPPC